MSDPLLDEAAADVLYDTGWRDGYDGAVETLRTFANSRSHFSPEDRVKLALLADILDACGGESGSLEKCKQKLHAFAP